MLRILKIIMIYTIFSVYGYALDMQIDCTKINIKNDKKFSGLYELNKKFIINQCKKYEYNIYDNNLIKENFIKNRDIVLSYFSDPLIEKSIMSYFSKLINNIDDYVVKNSTLPNLISNSPNNGYVELSISGINLEEKILIKNDSEDCKSVDGNKYINTLQNSKPNCAKAFRDIFSKINIYKTLENKLWIDKNKYLHSIINKKWEKYADIARTQTFIDIFASSFINSGHYKKDYLVEPSPVQFFFLHPNLGYEHIFDSKSGKKDDISLSLELIGVNYWDLKIPIGASVVGVYSDREEVSSIGWGGLLHINNNYSIGFTHRKKGGNAIFINFDLFKLFTDKKERYYEYKERYFD